MISSFIRATGVMPAVDPSNAALSTPAHDGSCRRESPDAIPKRWPDWRSSERSIQNVVSVSTLGLGLALADAADRIQVRDQRPLHIFQVFFQVAKSADGWRHKAQNDLTEAVMLAPFVRQERGIGLLSV